MAAIENTRPTAALNNGTFTTFFSGLVGNIAAWNDARITRKALSQLTERELDDIGLSRADVNRLDTLAR